MILKFQKRLFPEKSHIHNDFFCFFFPLFQSSPQLTHILASLVGMQESSVKARLQLDVSASPHASHRLRCKDVLPGCAGLHIPKTQLYPGSLWAEQGHNTTVGQGQLVLAFLRAFSEPPKPLHWGCPVLLGSTPSTHREFNGQGPSQNWEGCSILALVYTPHLWKHHCCTSLRDSYVGQNRRQTFCRALIIQARKTGGFLIKKSRENLFRA